MDKNNLKSASDGGINPQDSSTGVKGMPRRLSDDVMKIEPRAINVGKFAVARSVEINTMMKRVNMLGTRRKAFQNLPRHMRRRAASHNSKRLPRRLHQQFEVEQAKERLLQTDKSKTKTKRSRRHRRRHSNLRAEYQRRQRKHVWLETHLWHAKRFKMADMWGMQIPLHPSDKSARATYRAVAKHCLIQDISYCGVIEMSGPQGKILQALSHLTNQQTGLTFAAKVYLSGLYHGEVMLYHRDTYPHNAICPVTFLWRVLSTGDSNLEEESLGKFESNVCRQLWIWVHPACYETVLTQVKDICQQDPHSSIQIHSLKDDLVLFRLRGPLSHPILLDTLQVADVTLPSPSSQSVQLWWDKFYTTPNNSQAHRDQHSAWKSLQTVQSSSELRPRCVMGLTVRDPRIPIPEKRTKIMVDPQNITAPPASTLTKMPFNCASPLWDAEVRQAVKFTQMSQHQLNIERNKHLVPRTELRLGRQESRLPVLLLQNPGANSGCSSGADSSQAQGIRGYGAGWDVVLPSGWGMAFWIALIYRGARAGGLRESRSCALQQGVPHFPEDYVDTASGRDHAKILRKDLEAKQGRKPPAKRPNYARLGIPSPFNCEWTKLVEDWRKDYETKQSTSEEISQESGESAIMVLKDRVKLQQLNKCLHLPDKNTIGNIKETVFIEPDTGVKSQKRAASSQEMPCMSPKKKIKTANEDCLKDMENKPKKRRIDSTYTDETLSILPCKHSTYDADVLSSLGLHDPRMFVCVQISFIYKGAPGPFSIICLPSAADLSALAANPRYGGPVESIHTKFVLPKKPKKKGKSSSEDNARGKITTDMLGVPNLDDLNLLTFCSRKTVGYLTNAGHAFSTGKGYGVGYCCALGLQELLLSKPEDRPAIVLVRDTGSLQYRFANINVLV